MIVRNVLAEEDIGVFMKIEKHYGEGIMTERFTIKEWDIWDYADSILVIFQDGEFISNKDVVDLLNKQDATIQHLKQELFEAREAYLWETSDVVDRALYVEDEIEELKKEIFG